jgi:c-di-GMP-binding flagellar brake protein YcgR
MDGTKYLELNQTLRILPEEASLEDWSASTIQDIDQQFFYIAIPVRRTVPLMLREGAQVQVQIPGPTGMVLFSTRVVGWRRDAIPLMALALPTQVERIERRSFVRLSLLLDTMIAEIPEEGKEPVWVRGQMLDISGGGLRVAVRKNFKIGARMMVSFALPGGSIKDNISVRGEIKRVHETGQSGALQIGIQFLDLPSKYQDTVIRFIFEKLKEAGRMRSETGL